ncbi:Putative Mn2+ efflux pump MntP [Lachnobacterium bovis DSM 14045]|uniref:Putative manganese efflux pump MntP n=1 Tax=Lachnobacterium bovis DSM 14045 TaxID=1122142 RepID=A0A1H3L1X0_9FIRM|nr:Putative Mn2+ efflux pump MntP [Lachnobacterium bovis DSM 14045]
MRGIVNIMGFLGNALINETYPSADLDRALFFTLFNKDWRKAMGLFELILLAIGLAMDAFAVSICKGLAVKKLTIKEGLICGIWFGTFQGIMPFIGFLIGSRFERWIKIVAPWVAFILLTIIGINMIKEAFEEEEEDARADFDFKSMFVLAIATSIDALAVGITFVAVPVNVLAANVLINTIFGVLVIAVITFFISAIGVKIGNAFGTRYKSGSEVMGGTILIFIGLKTLIEALDTTGAVKDSDTVFGMLIPLIGTVLGALFVYQKKAELSDKMRMILGGLSSGIMLSIAVWGMIEPATNGFKVVLKGVALSLFVCFFAGVLMQSVLDMLVPHTHAFVDITEGPKVKLKPETKMMLSEIIHHVPEGMALGAVFGAHFIKTEWIPMQTPVLLALAIAVQNFPEALFVSLPIMQKGIGKGKAFLMGIISGVSVPLVAVFTLIIVTIFPVTLAFIMAIAGGALIFTTIEELPIIVSDKDNDSCTFAFIIGFVIFMVLIFR